MDSPAVTTVWDFKRCDPRFGRPYPGRLPGQVVANLLRLYTQNEDLVLDVFAGSGTVNDVCEATGRRCLSFDLSPKRSFIRRHDASEALPVQSGSAKLVLIDPPYWNMLKGRYTMSKRDLSRVGLDRFLMVMSHLAAESLRTLVADGVACVVISSKRNPREGFVDLPFLTYERFRDLLVPDERICLVYRNATSHTDFWRQNCLIQGTLLRGYRDLMVFRKP